MGKLTKPTKPKGMNKGTSVRRGRVPGFAPNYTPEQTARYQSQALRYSKAVELSAGGPDHIEWNGQILSGDDAANLRDAGGRAFKLTDRVGFYYQSGRSKVDYWTVRYGGGGLEDLTTFIDAITTTGTSTCPAPVVTWSWENPAFDWSAKTIKVCAGSGGSKGSAGSGSGGSSPPAPDPAPYATPPDWFPGQPGQAISGYYTVTGNSSSTSYSLSCPAASDSSPPYTFSRSFYIPAGQPIRVFGGASSGFAFTTNCHGSTPSGIETFSGALLLIPGQANIQLASSGVFSNGDDYNTSSLSASVAFVFDTPPQAPPSSPSPGYTPTPGVPNGYSLPPLADPYGPSPPTKATAGGTFTSNTFTASSTSVQVQLDYTTVPDIGAITGAIAVQLWSAAGVMLAELRETPSNGGAGTLEATFDLTEGEVYYFKVVIPETCYCDAAKVAIGGSGFKCDCPDYTKAQKPSLNSVYNSEQVDRDWTSSEAGCDQEQGCKHINGTKLFLGLPVEPPTDYPV